MLRGDPPRIARCRRVPAAGLGLHAPRRRQRPAVGAEKKESGLCRYTKVFKVKSA